MQEFHCHVCEALFTNDQPICPICNGEFVEQVEEEEDSNGGNWDESVVQINPQQLFNMLAQQFIPNHVNNNNNTEHQGHMAGDRNIPHSEAASNFPMDDNPMMRGIAALLAGQFGAENPLASLFNIQGDMGDYVFGERGLDDIITHLMEQASKANAPPPASAQVISSLPKVRASLFDEVKDCSICQDAFGAEEYATQMPCKHLYHTTCIEYWLKMNGTCPVCRHSISTPPSSTETDTPSLST